MRQSRLIAKVRRSQSWKVKTGLLPGCCQRLETKRIWWNDIGACLGTLQLYNSQSISRVLCPLRGVCHSSMPYVTIWLKRSTLRLGRATLKRRFTWTCSLQDTQPVHRCTAGGLLPHLLTLTLAGGYFLLRYSTFADGFLLGSGVLCAARTFLLCLAATATDCPTVLLVRCMFVVDLFLFCMDCLGSDSRCKDSVKELIMTTVWDMKFALTKINIKNREISIFVFSIVVWKVNTRPAFAFYLNGMLTGRL